MIYLTYNDAPSGIYFSQVTDVCRFMNQKLHANIQLVALISRRDFLQNKRKIKAQLPDAIVIRMFPKVKFWKMNSWILFFLFLFLDSSKVMARGAFACNLALRMKKKSMVKKVCFDGRGAYTAELNEYDVVGVESVKKEIGEVEKDAVLNRDRKSTRLNSSHIQKSRMPSSA